VKSTKLSQPQKLPPNSKQTEGGIRLRDQEEEHFGIVENLLRDVLRAFCDVEGRDQSQGPKPGKEKNQGELGRSTGK